jgi:hypothetical protein
MTKKNKLSNPISIVHEIEGPGGNEVGGTSYAAKELTQNDCKIASGKGDCRVEGSP